MAVHYVIGCGGVGCWLVPLLKKMVPKKDQIAVMDGDRIEQKNFDRQLHSPEHLYWNKAEALSYQHDLGQFYPRYLSRVTRPPLRPIDWVWCCVDNHAGRRECLEWVDEKEAHGLFGGNEYQSSQAYLYLSDWKGRPLDPRIRYPEILTDTSNDPVHPNCQGIAQEAAPQLALFNYLAAGKMVQLYHFWLNYALTVEELYWPVEHNATFIRFDTFRVTELESNESIHFVSNPSGEIQDREVSSDD
jgi:ThiF family